MRRLEGTFLPAVAADRPRRGDVYRALRSAMLEGVLAGGARLPSTRQAAADYGVSRGMLEEIYAQLTDEGFLDRGVGRGTFVAPTLSRLSAPVPGGDNRRKAALSRRGRAAASMAACREPAIARPFNAGVADASEFPWKVWQRLEGRAVRELGRGGLNFADPRGLRSLRTSIAQYLAQFRGLRCSADQVVVFNSAQQALHALALLLLDRGDSVWMEDPGYLGARAAFELAGAAITPVTVDQDGMRVDLGIRRAPRARIVYVTPSHQYPTGVALALDRRLALIEWAARNRGWIVEDDYDGEFRYEGQPLTALFSLDSQARVFYIGTLSKAMFVSLRLAYAVAPEEMVEPLANLRTQLDGFTPPVRQLAMSRFLDEGHFASHLRRMRSLYGAKRATLVEGLAPLSAMGWTWPATPAGMHLLVSHEQGEYAREVAARSCLDLALLSAYRRARRSDDGLLLRFGGLDTESVRAGTAALVEAALRIYTTRRG